MRITKTIIALAAMSLTVCATSTAPFAISKRTAATAVRDVAQLVRMMDKDRNGAVSKEEFINFMSQIFDRLDLNKSGTLERDELQKMTIPNWLVQMQEPPPG